MNDRPDVNKLVRRIVSLPVKLIDVEAAGAWNLHAPRVLHEAGHRVAVINPCRSRKLADALGFLQTDTIDAWVLALLAMHVGPRPTPPPSAKVEALKELVTANRRRI